MAFIFRAFGAHIPGLWRSYPGLLALISRAFGAHIPGFWRSYPGLLALISRAFGAHIPGFWRSYPGPLALISRAFGAGISSSEIKFTLTTDGQFAQCIATGPFFARTRLKRNTEIGRASCRERV